MIRNVMGRVQHLADSTPVMSMGVSQEGGTFFPSFYHFYHLTFPGFPYTLITSQSLRSQVLDHGNITSSNS